jgi:thioredoxin reductase (NADPH)
MSRPVLMVVDDQAGDLETTERELRKRYAADYEIVCEPSPGAALQWLEAHTATGAPVAILLADLWMPEMTGVEFLERAHDLHPQAKRLLLTNWGDSSAIETISQATRIGWIDDFSGKPLRAPDEQFHRHIAELLDGWSHDHQPPVEVIQIVGERWSERSHEMRDLLERYDVWYRFYEADSEDGQALLRMAGKPDGPFPVVLLYTGQVMTDPSYADIADALGAHDRIRGGIYDLIIIGAGPAGLSAAVYGASEGLHTMVVEREAIGGQAGTSSRIRNYLGFSTGIGGGELANRAYTQAWLFGAEFYFLREVTGLRADGGQYVVALSDGKEFLSRAVVLAMGAAYQRLGIPSLEGLVGAGVFYGGAVTEAMAMQGKQVFVTGAGNSAGQTALHLAKYAQSVTIVARGESLRASMSDYLVQEIEATTNIAVRLQTQVVEGRGARRLEGLVLKDGASGETSSVSAAALFVLVGAQPHTGWLPASVLRDGRGFILTGTDLMQDGKPPEAWPLQRAPFLLETSLPGVFAAGDVRLGSQKRVASAVGDGSTAIQFVHQYFSEHQKVI